MTLIVHSSIQIVECVPQELDLAVNKHVMLIASIATSSTVKKNRLRFPEVHTFIHFSSFRFNLNFVSLQARDSDPK